MSGQDPVRGVKQPHPAQALGGCKTLPDWPGGAFLVPGLICRLLLKDPAGTVCNATAWI